VKPATHFSGEIAMSTVREQVVTALGEAVMARWSHLPQPVQEELFEQASLASPRGVDFREDLAVCLHQVHARTQPR
jgi:hypothetical protein